MLLAPRLRTERPQTISAMQKITPFLWFDTQAEEAAKFYISVFKNGKITGTTRYTADGPGVEGTVMTVAFELNGQKFIALNGGPHFKFTEAVSFVINCETQEEIDYYWEKLTADGGEDGQCGWLTDKYGLSWQLVPVQLAEWAKDAARFPRVMKAVLQMKKIDLRTVQQAYNGH